MADRSRDPTIGCFAASNLSGRPSWQVSTAKRNLVAHLPWVQPILPSPPRMSGESSRTSLRTGAASSNDNSVRGKGDRKERKLLLLVVRRPFLDDQ